jgi:hypothetical protein
MQTGQATVIEPITASTEIGRIACIPCSGLPVRDFVRELAYRQVTREAVEGQRKGKDWFNRVRGIGPSGEFTLPFTM